ncbi:MAG: hypothetical protein M3313_17540, partial [Actinomycetota bacterium]|nr:hypothetical protein [Actinomycetota bacterium]
MHHRKSGAPSLAELYLDEGLILSTTPGHDPVPGVPAEATVEGWTGVKNGSGRSLAGVVLCLVTAGLLVNVYLAVLARVLSEAEYGRFISFVSITLLISFGGFLPIEQEMARQFQTGHSGREVQRASTVVSGVVALVTAALLVALIPWLMPTLASGQMMAALLTVCAVCMGQFLVRGTLIGTGRMAQHGWVLLLDA